MIPELTRTSDRGCSAAASAKGRPPLHVDGRMLFSSGVGRYLREILSRRPSSADRPLNVICNGAEQRDWIATHVPKATVTPSSAGIYSMGEQIQASRLPAEATFWVPHYNVPMWSRSRLVSTIHDLAPLALPEVFSGVHRRLAARFYFGCAKRRAHRIIAVSNFTRNEILSRGIAEPERVTAIPNGVGTYWFEGEAPAVRRPRLLFVGNLKPHKNLARLVEAVERVRTTNAVELAVAGKIEGFRTGIASDALARLRSTPWITLLGELTDQELRSQYSECSALVFPSMYEGFGLPLLEAMAGGCPVVSSKAPALAEIGGPERSEGGIVEYFDPLDCEDMARAIRRHLASSEVERRLIGEAGRRRAADYTWERTASATWDLLERACRS